jgi:hypothetical protein
LRLRRLGFQGCKFWVIEFLRDLGFEGFEGFRVLFGVLGFSVLEIFWGF